MQIEKVNFFHNRPEGSESAICFVGEYGKIRCILKRGMTMSNVERLRHKGRNPVPPGRGVASI